MSVEKDLKAPLITCQNIKKYFPVKDKRVKGTTKFVRAIDDVSFDIMPGEIYGIVGESGSGKSTIGRCMINLIHTTEGEIRFKGTAINQLSKKAFDAYRHEIQMVFQNPFASFNPRKRIDSIFIELGKTIGLNKTESLGKASELLEMVSLFPQFEILKRYPKHLSGGQLQRLAIARALMLSPSFLIADEPVSALDVSVQAHILNLFVELRNKLGLTIMFISHDLTVVGNICDKVAVVYLGTIVELGKPEKIFNNILHPYSEALISAKPKTHPLENKERIILEGNIPNAIDIKEGCRFAERCRYAQDKCKNVSPKLVEIEEGHEVACHFPLYK